MKVLYHQEGAVTHSNPLICRDNVIYLKVKEPVIVQPSEIMKVPTGITLRVGEGCILSIYTDPELAQRTAELFPAVIVLDCDSPSQQPLELPVRNSGRNPLNLMPGQALARAYGVRAEILDTEEFFPEFEEVPSLPKTKPAKKNPGTRFEMR